MRDTELKHRQMTTDPPAKLVLRHSLPTVLAAVLPAVATIADAFFMARLGTAACGAVGVVFPIIAAIQTIGFVFGTGAGSMLSRALGAKQQKEADRIASASLWVALLISVTFGILGILLRSPLLRLLGADGEILPLARTYAVCLLVSAPLICISFVLSNLLRAEGHTVWAMLGMGSGNLLSIALAPLLIFSLKGGVLGAGLAIAIGYGFSTCLLLSAYLFRKSTVFLLAQFDRTTVLRTIVNGLPSLFRQGLTVVAVTLLNRAARPYGAAALASLAVVSRLFLLLYAFLLGIGQGMLPAAGYNYGNGDHRRTLAIYRVSILYACALAVLLAVPTAVFAPFWIGLFRKDTEIVTVGVPLLRAFCLVLPLHGLIAVTNILLQGLGKPIQASLVASARQGLFFLPLIFFLPHRFGLTGVILTQPIADGLTFLFTLPFVFFLFQNLSKPKIEKTPDAT